MRKHWQQQVCLGISLEVWTWTKLTIIMVLWQNSFEDALSSYSSFLFQDRRRLPESCILPVLFGSLNGLIKKKKNTHDLKLKLSFEHFPPFSPLAPLSYLFILSCWNLVLFSKKGGCSSRIEGIWEKTQLLMLRGFSDLFIRTLILLLSLSCLYLFFVTPWICNSNMDLYY